MNKPEIARKDGMRREDDSWNPKELLVVSACH